MWRIGRISRAKVVLLFLLAAYETLLIPSQLSRSKSRFYAKAATSSSTPVSNPPTGIETTSINPETSRINKQHQSTMSNEDILIVFSDVDGTLVHYPEQLSPEQSGDNGLLYLPPSSTGMQGIISHITLSRCQELRKKHNKKLVLVSGMRTETLWKRIPFLPKADAYCSEAGGRIFFPVEISDVGSYQGTAFQPQNYEGAREVDLVPFGIREDTEWRKVMEETAGADGFRGMELIQSANDDGPVPISERSGLLWEFCRQLESKGLIIDTKGYSTCFRVNRKQQKDSQLFDELLAGCIIEIPPGLATSTNLGCIDFYPNKSGKKNCCAYLTGELFKEDSPQMRKHTVCLCDDDNDLEMALACNHAYVPGISSDSMQQTIAGHADHITVTGGVDGLSEGTEATDHALSLVLERVGGPKLRP